MQCPSCGTLFEGRFCPMCATDTQPYAYLCPVCGTAFTAWACPRCGTPIRFPEQARGTGIRVAGSIVWSISLLVFLLLLAVSFVVLLYTAWLVVQGAILGGPRIIFLYVLLPIPVGVPIDAGLLPFLAYFALIVGAIIAAYVWYAYRDGRATLGLLWRPLRELRPRLEARSAWVVTGQVFLAAMFFQVAFILALVAAGFEPTSPELPPGIPDWYLYYSLANASVYEELVARLLLIGVPLAAVAFASRIARVGRSDGSGVPAWRHLVGGTINRTSPAPLLLAATLFVFLASVVFGLAHVPSWGWWKFLPSFVAGLGMGYLFVRRGLLSAILFHFATDYLAAIGLLAGDSLGAQVLVGLLVFVLVGLGLVYFIWYIVYGVEVANHMLASWGLRRPAPAVANRPPMPSMTVRLPPPTNEMVRSPPPAPFPAPPAEPPSPNTQTVPPYGTGFFQYRCARCGWREARYEAGRFTCLRCGYGT